MPTNSATPDLMEALASTLGDRAVSIESWAVAAAGICQSHGHWTSAAGVSGSGYGASAWAQGWAASLRERAALLEQYDQIALLGSGAAGGAGAALGAARTWALGSPGLDFTAWYEATVAATIAWQRHVRLGRDLAGAWRMQLIEDPDALIHDLDALSPVAAAAFFEAIGLKEITGILRWITPPLGTRYGLPHRFDEAVAMALGRAWDSEGLDDDWRQTLMTDTYGWDLLYHAGLLGQMGGEYWGMLAARIIGEGPRTDIARNPHNSSYSYIGVSDHLQDLLENDGVAAHAFVTSPALYMQRGLERDYPVEGWIEDVLRTRLAALDDIRFVDVVAGMALTVAAFGGDISDPPVEALLNDAVTARRLSPQHQSYLTGALVKATGSGGIPEPLLPELAAAMVVDFDHVLDAVAGYDHLAVGLFPHPAGTGSLRLTEAEVEGALRLIAEDEAAMAILMEDLQVYFVERIEQADDAASLSRLGSDLGAVSGALVTAINTAAIEDAKEKDERRAAVIGFVSLLVAAVPVPGLGLASSGIQGAGRRLISASYGDLKRRGLAPFESNDEGTARVAADEFKELFVDEMSALMILGSLAADGTLESTVADFHASHPEAADFTINDTITTTTPEQSQSLNEFLQWVAAGDPELHVAVLTLVTEFAGEIPTWND